MTKKQFKQNKYPLKKKNGGHPNSDIPIPLKNWLALPVGNEGPSTFTAWYIGDETEPSFPTGRASSKRPSSERQGDLTSFDGSFGIRRAGWLAVGGFGVYPW